jgi:hypothetical protein
MRGPRVFVVQNQQKFDHSLGKLVPKFDLKPAEQHGELVYLLSPTAAPFSPDGPLSDIHSALHDYHSERDCLLLIGNPVLIGFAVTIAADKSETGQVRLLQWSGKDRAYILVEASIFPFT